MKEHTNRLPVTTEETHSNLSQDLHPSVVSNIQLPPIKCQNSELFLLIDDIKSTKFKGLTVLR